MLLKRRVAWVVVQAAVVLVAEAVTVAAAAADDVAVASVAAVRAGAATASPRTLLSPPQRELWASPLPAPAVNGCTCVHV